jgi:L-arabinonolactonase
MATAAWRSGDVLMATFSPIDSTDPRAGDGDVAATLLVDSRCLLGESILWCERRQVCWWTDIESSRLWRHTLAEGKTQSWRLPDRLGCLALCESGRLLLGLADSLCMLEIEDIDGVVALHPQKLVGVPLASPMVRVNDGRCDRSGNFVFGTMNEGADRARLGRFHQYSHAHGLRPLELEGVAIANSLCFAPDGRSLYYCDSLQRRIMRCAYGASTASVGSPEVFAEIEPPAEPDGAAIDRDGRLWSAQWAAGRVVCYDEHGRIERTIEVPVSNPSCLAFAGASLDRLLITTARKDLSEAQLHRQPHAGGVYSAHLPAAAGLPETRFADL